MHFIGIGITAVLGLAAGWYVGYKYGAKIEKKATAERDAIKQVATDSKKLV